MNNLVDSCPDTRTGNENIDPSFPLEIDVENSLENKLPLLDKRFEDFSKNNKVIEITKEKLVSIDFNHNPASSIIDASLTNVIGKNMGKISAWYDNEWRLSSRMCDIAEYLHKISY